MVIKSRNWRDEMNTSYSRGRLWGVEEPVANSCELSGSVEGG
jgi:hypothetical protein